MKSFIKALKALNSVDNRTARKNKKIKQVYNL